MEANNKLVLPNLGWVFPSTSSVASCSQSDKNIAKHCEKYGNLGFTFLVYPLGGLQRFHWEPNSVDAVPPIHLPVLDLQLKTEFWAKYVVCSLSRWIDPDSSEEWLAQLSSTHFLREIEYAKYLGVRKVLLELRHPDSPKLAELINKSQHLTGTSIDFWILLPSCAEKLGSVDEEMWTIWHNFRTLCRNSRRLFVGLSFTADLDQELTTNDETSLRRWYAEPLVLVHLDYSLFISDANGPVLSLPKAHSQLLNYLIVSRNQHVILSSLNTELSNQQLQQMLCATQQHLLANEDIYKREFSVAGFLDLLQSPLQPLSDNLDSTVYQAFERDLTKYRIYQKAIKEALFDLFNSMDHDHESIVVYVLGAGRGPLVDATIKAKNELEKEAKQNNKHSTSNVALVAVEKNRNAVLSLEYCNEEKWNNSVKIIHSDMRSLSGLIDSGILMKPDLIISELLGSFSDNELCPECLDAVDPILKPSTICIPHSYTNYITPIQSLPLYQNVMDADKYTHQQSEHCMLTGRAQKRDEELATDRYYVVCMDQYCHLADTVEPCFEFVHPNKEKKSNSRQSRIHFTLQPNCELMGFAGHFEAHLYKDITLSTHPFRTTENLYSWFQTLFPLRALYHFKAKTNVVFNICRKIDSGGCWYEWNFEFEGTDGQMVKSELQNVMGHSQYMKLY